MKIFKRIACFFVGHNWTSDAIEGKQPVVSTGNLVADMKKHAQLYCSRCEKSSKLNKRLQNGI